MESEQIALATASEEANWLINFLADTPLWERPTLAVLIHYDSTAATLEYKTIIITARVYIYVENIALLDNIYLQVL